MFFQLGDDRSGLETGFLHRLFPALGFSVHHHTFLLPAGICLSPSLLQHGSEGLLFCGRLLLLLPRRLDALPRLLYARPRDFGAGGALGQDCRQFLPGHERNSARGDRTHRAQNGEILQPVSVGSVTFSLDPVDRDDPRVRELYAEFIREADGPLVYDREGSGVDLDEEIAAGPPADLVPPNGILLLARADGEPAGLGGIRHLDTEIAEVKSMYVAPAFRGTGLGRRILARLDEIALEHGCRAVRLDTSDYLTPAVGLYRAAGYREVPAYNENPKADLWFERSLRQGD
jgi:GNAT superfamily N-acetyltransferase